MPAPKTNWTALLALALAGCGGDEPAAPQAPSPQPPAPARNVPALAPERSVQAPPTAPVKLYDVAPPHLESWNAENYRRVDPQADGWPLEALHDQLKPLLVAWVERAWGAPGAAPAAHEGLEGATVLRPEPREVLLDDGTTRVERASAIAAELRPAAELEALCAALRAPFGSAAPRASVWIESVERNGAEALTEARLTVAAEVGAGAVQHNARWRVRWSLPDGAAPRVRTVEVLAFEEVATRTRTFADHTGLWLGAQTWLEREVRHSVGDAIGRQDKLAGEDSLGLQGFALGDVNGDGLDDLYVCSEAGVPNRLLLQQPDGTVLDGTTEARVGFLDGCNAALIADMDGDGASDLVAGIGPNLVVAFNDGRGVFSEQVALGGKSAGVEDIYSLAAGDPDDDGDLDVYCCRYVQGGMIAGVPLPYHDADNGAPNLYWRNLGGRRFENATEDAGFASSNRRYSLAALWEDLDDDGDLDLYVANDFGRNNLFLNEGGRFRDVAGERGAEDMAAGMGVTCADFDLDGTLDLYVSNMYSAAGLRLVRQADLFLGGAQPEHLAAYRRHARGNTLLRGLGQGRFEDATERTGGAEAGWAWGALATDFDRDGYEDLLVPNGFVSNDGGWDVESFFWRRVVGQSPRDASASEPYRQAWASMQHMVMNARASYNGGERNTAFRNLGGRGFADVSACAGFDFADDSRAVALCDWDDDGRLDALLRSRTAPRLRFLRNQDPSPSRFVALDLVGRQCNRDAIGARVTLRAGGRTYTRSLRAGEGLLAQSSKRLHFGLGSAQRIDELEVRWPGGSRSRFESLAVDARYRIVQGEAEATLVPPRAVRTFAEAAPSPLAPAPEPLRRFVLIEKLPAAPLAVTLFDGSTHSLAQLAGAPLLAVVWSSADERSRWQLEQLAAQAAEFDRAGVRLLLLSADDGPALFQARKLARELGIEARCGLADGALRRRLQVLYVEALGDTRAVELPAALVFDARAQWVLGYLGPFDPAGALADAAAVALLDPEARQAAKLLGGRWLLRRRRDWALLFEIFRELGEPELAELYRAHGAAEASGR